VVPASGIEAAASGRCQRP